MKTGKNHIPGKPIDTEAFIKQRQKKIQHRLQRGEAKTVKEIPKGMGFYALG